MRTGYIYENRLSMTQKERTKWNGHLETIEKCYRDLVKLLNKKNGTLPLKLFVKNKREKCVAVHTTKWLERVNNDSKENILGGKGKRCRDLVSQY